MKPFPVERTQYAKKKRHSRLKENYQILLGCEELENEVRKLSLLKPNSRKRKRSRSVRISHPSSVSSIAWNPPSILPKDDPKKYAPISLNEDRKKKSDRSRSPKKTDLAETETECRSGIESNSVRKTSPILCEEKIEKRRRREKDDTLTVKSANTQERRARVTKLGTSIRETSSLEEVKKKEMVHETLAAKLSLILRDGLLDEIRNELSSEYSLAPSYEYLEAPVLNTDLKAILSEKHVKADQRECSVQNQLSFALVAIEKILTSLLSVKDESRLMAQTVDTLIDVELMLADAHHSFSVKRRTNVISAFDIGDIVDLSRVEATLFSKRFLNVLKSARLLVEGEESKVEVEQDGKTKRPQTSAERTSVAPNDREDETKKCGKVLVGKTSEESETDGQEVPNGEKKDTNNATKVANSEKKVSSGETKVTDSQQKVTNDERKVTNDEQKVINNEKEGTNGETKVTNSEKKETNNERKVTNGEKEVINNERKVTNGEKNVSNSKTKVTSCENKGINHEKNRKCTANNDVKNSEGCVRKSEKLDNNIAENSRDKRNEVVRNCIENATKKEKSSDATKTYTTGSEVARNNGKDSCDEKPKNHTKDSSDKDPSEKDKDPPEEDKDPQEKDKGPPEEDKDPREKGKDPPEKDKDPSEEDKDPQEKSKDPPEKAKDPLEKNQVLAGRDGNPAEKGKEPGSKSNDENQTSDMENVPKVCSNVIEKVPKESQLVQKTEVKFKTKHESAEDLLLNLKNVSLRIIDEITAVYQKRIDALQPQDKKLKPEIKVSKESTEVKPFPGIRDALRGAYVAQGHSEVAAETMLYSLAPSTMKGYERPIRYWWDFCAKRKIDVYQGTVRDVIQFFVDHENVISSHNVLAMWRSALGEFTLEDLGKSKSIANYVKGFTCVRAGKHEPKCRTKIQSCILTGADGKKSA